MDAINDPANERVVVMKSSQVGWTEIINNSAGYFIHQDPSPILVIQPTLEMGEAWSKDRLAPMLRDTPALHGKVKSAKSRDSGNTLLHKVFPGGHLTVAGANSPASLASRPIRVVFFDEVDRYPSSAGSEGDPIELGIKRAVTYWNRRVLIGSTATIAGRSRIETEYERSDKRKYFVPCPHCGERQTLEWGRVQWPAGEPEKAAYGCEHCGVLWSDVERWAAVRQGEWRATAEFRGIAGFHIWAAYSPWVKLADLVRDFLAAKDHPEQLKVWVNTTLGETWRDKGEAPDWHRLYDRREDYDGAPMGALLLTAFADVQRDRIELYVWGWGRNSESWMVDFRVFEGDPARSEPWEALTRALSETWRHESGADLRITRMGIDSGYATQEVYNWARKQRPGFVTVTKGQSSMTAPALGAARPVDVTSGGATIKRGIRLWPVGVSVLKSELYGRFRLEAPVDGQPYPAGYVHLPQWATDEICKQLVAEQLVTYPSGRREWDQLRARNEALDCAVGARAIAISLGIDRWGDARWTKLAIDLGITEPEPEEPPAPSIEAPTVRPSPAVAARTMSQRRVIRNSLSR